MPVHIIEHLTKQTGHFSGIPNLGLETIKISIGGTAMKNVSHETGTIRMQLGFEQFKISPKYEISESNSSFFFKNRKYILDDYDWFVPFFIKNKVSS